MQLGKRRHTNREVGLRSHELDKVGYGLYQLNRLARQLGECLAHLSVLDSDTVVNIDTGETVAIDDLWKEPQRDRKSVV